MINRLKMTIKNGSAIREILNTCSCKKRIERGRNSVDCNCILRRSKINIVGKNNRIDIGKAKCRNSYVIVIRGNSNQVTISDEVVSLDTTIWIEGDNNKVTIGTGTAMTGAITISAIEGTSVTIGQDCLFSSGIDIRTGDGHSILDKSRIRTNTSKSIDIGDHVWVGKEVCIGKGADIASNCVIGIRSVVTKPIMETGCLIAGIPAKIVKREINWSYDRL